MFDPALEGIVDVPPTGPLLVSPMSGDTVFSMLVHLRRADLNFERLAVIENDRRVQRLVEIVLWRSDIVVEFTGDGTPGLVNDGESLVAGQHVGNQHPDGPHVENLIEGKLLALHLAPDAVDMLGPANHRCLDPVLVKDIFKALDQVLHVLVAVGAALVDQLGDLFVTIRLQIPERQVFKLPFELPDSQAAGEWGEDFDCLAGIAHLPFR